MPVQQIVNELKNSLNQLLPAKINKIILYGSYARKEASTDSDIDVLVICNGMIDSQLRERIYEECYTINSKYDVWIDVSLLSENDLTTIRGKQPYIQNALCEGIVL
ncbi:MAG: nucleotidyltransferase domain-containing protein [Ignavibacteriales bacterium]|nr:nucleotidyltransferase domain-containing protein [Ignavibacteriales bacterium]